MIEVIMDNMTVEQFLKEGNLFVDWDEYESENGRVTIGDWITAETANTPSKYDKDLKVVSAKCLEKSNKHPHHDMICAKAANMDLKTFKLGRNGRWTMMSNAIPIAEDIQYFLCLPQHAEACLHWMNGGELIDWELRHNSKFKWSRNCVFMDDRFDFKIKPRTEKRWAIYLNHNDIMMASNFKDKASAESIFTTYGWCKDYAQIIEIEIEV